MRTQVQSGAAAIPSPPKEIKKCCEQEEFLRRHTMYWLRDRGSLSLANVHQPCLNCTAVIDLNSEQLQTRFLLL